MNSIKSNKFISGPFQLLKNLKKKFSASTNKEPINTIYWKSDINGLFLSPIPITEDSNEWIDVNDPNDPDLINRILGMQKETAKIDNSDEIKNVIFWKKENNETYVSMELSPNRSWIKLTPNEFEKNAEELLLEKKSLKSENIEGIEPTQDSTVVVDELADQKLSKSEDMAEFIKKLLDGLSSVKPKNSSGGSDEMLD